MPELSLPENPESVKWSPYYPEIWEAFREAQASQNLLLPQVEMLDIGCGYGGFLVALGHIFPDRISLGLEIRTRVVQYVEERIKTLRREAGAMAAQGSPLSASFGKYPYPLVEIKEQYLEPREANEGQNASIEPHFHPAPTNAFHNVAVMQCNAMKSLPLYFKMGQIKKMFFLFPDPQFKRTKHRLRIINRCLLDQYAYLLATGGRLYIATDVNDLFLWMDSHLRAHPLFKNVPEEGCLSDPLYPFIQSCTEESKKVMKENRKIECAIFERVEYQGRAFQCGLGELNFRSEEDARSMSLKTCSSSASAGAIG